MSLLISSCFFTSCVNGYKLAVFTYNNHKHNGCIVNRRPDYGDGHADGCLVMREFRLDIKKVDKNSIEGRLTDVESAAPLNSSRIQIFYYNTALPLELITDEKGQFTCNKATEIQKIQAFALSYRMLLVDFTGRNLLQH